MPQIMKAHVRQTRPRKQRMKLIRDYFGKQILTIPIADNSPRLIPVFRATSIITSIREPPAAA